MVILDAWVVIDKLAAARSGGQVLYGYSLAVTRAA
jgi:hypothetical protein